MGQQDDNYDLTEKRMILERILPILSDREREIIQCTFIEGLSQKLVNVLDLVKCMYLDYNELQYENYNKLLSNEIEERPMSSY